MTAPSKFGPELHVNTTTPDHQENSTVTALANGKFVVVWEDLLQEDVRGQLFNADGSRAGGEFFVSEATGDQFGATATALQDGRFVVAWTQFTDFTGESTIAARIFNSDGAPSGDQFTVNTSTGKPVLDPAIAALKGGGFAVTWTREFSGTDFDVHGRAFDAAGTALGSDFPIDINGKNLEEESAVVGLANGNYAVVWQDRGDGTDTDGSGSHIRGQIFSGNGVAVTNQFIVNSTHENDQSNPSIALLSNGDFIVTWTSDFGAGDLNVRGRVFHQDGTPLDSDVPVDDETPEPEFGSAVTAVAGGGFIAAWENGAATLETDGSASHIRGQIGGAPEGDEFVVNATANGEQGQVSLTTLADGRVVATWTDFGGNFGDEDSGIRAQILDPRTHGVTLNGSGLDDDWVGSAFGDTLNGGDGNDHIDGGAGGDRILGGEGDNELVGGAGADLLFGGFGRDRLDGGEGNDLLNGFAGADTMAGGAGNDFYTVDEADDVIVENAGEGFDAVFSSISFTLPSNFEKLDLDNSGGNINATGNGRDNTITGNTGNNVIDGGAGADKMDGGFGGGDDFFIVDNLGDVVTEGIDEGTDTVASSVSFALAANIENLTLIGTRAINGTGNQLANTVTGNDAANRIDGGGGADRMAGGAGNDTYRVDNAGDVVTEDFGEGTDTVISSITLRLGANLENLKLAGAAAINGSGNELANVITGNDAANVIDGGIGNDLLNGGAGADTMVGGVGDDTYVVDDLGDVVVETAGGGVDRIVSSVAFTLGDNFENLILTGSANANANAPAGRVKGTGNALANTITGSATANKLDGGKGSDRLDGGDGLDILKGGKGKDSFVFDSALNAKSNVDKIADFSGKDHIVLDDAIFSDLTLGKLKGAFFALGVHAKDGGDHVIYNAKNGKLFYDADGKGGADQVLFAKLAKHLDLTHHDFQVV